MDDQIRGLFVQPISDINHYRARKRDVSLYAEENICVLSGAFHAPLAI